MPAGWPLPASGSMPLPEIVLSRITLPGHVLARRMGMDADASLAVIPERVVDDPVVVGGGPGEWGEHADARAAVALGDVVDDEVVVDAAHRRVG